MIPEEFVDFSKGFEVGFLVWIKDGRPTMKRSDFRVSSDKVVVEPYEYDPLRLPMKGEKVTLIFANPLYTERCEMGIIKGNFRKGTDTLEILPVDITWTLAFDIDTYPERILRRWRRR